MSLVNAVQSWRYCTNKGALISCISPLSTEEERAQVKFEPLSTQRKRELAISWQFHLMLSQKRSPVKIEGQKEFCVRCPQAHRPGMSLRFHPAQGDSRECVGRVREELCTGMIYDGCKCKKIMYWNGSVNIHFVPFVPPSRRRFNNNGSMYRFRNILESFFDNMSMYEFQW